MPSKSRSQEPLGNIVGHRTSEFGSTPLKTPFWESEKACLSTVIFQLSILSVNVPTGDVGREHQFLESRILKGTAMRSIQSLPSILRGGYRFLFASQLITEKAKSRNPTAMYIILSLWNRHGDSPVHISQRR